MQVQFGIFGGEAGGPGGFGQHSDSPPSRGEDPKDGWKGTSRRNPRHVEESTSSEETTSP